LKPPLLTSWLPKEMARIAASNLKAFPNVVTGEGNSEALNFPDATFDRYYANYVLHLTTCPEKMIQEAFRVLQPGGMAGFVVWGRRENSPQFTLPVTTMTKAGLPLPQSTTRSPFHLGDLEKTRGMLLAAGFGPVVAWYSVRVWLQVSSSFRLSSLQ